MSEHTRRHIPVAEKVATLKRHLVEGTPVSKEKKIEPLEAKVQRKNEVLAELMEEHTKLKKDLGEVSCPPQRVPGISS